jgi:transcriptional regulator with XRE-family HTH domain
VAALIRACGLTDEQLAEKLMMARSTVNRWRNSASAPGDIEAFAQALSVDPAVVSFGSEEEVVRAWQAHIMATLPDRASRGT